MRPNSNSSGNKSSAKQPRFTVIKVVVKVFDSEGNEIIDLRKEYFDIYDTVYKKRMMKNSDSEKEAALVCAEMNDENDKLFTPSPE